MEPVFMFLDSLSEPSRLALVGLAMILLAVPLRKALFWAHTHLNTRAQAPLNSTPNVDVQGS